MRSTHALIFHTLSNAAARRDDLNNRYEAIRSATLTRLRRHPIVGRVSYPFLRIDERNVRRAKPMLGTTSQLRTSAYLLLLSETKGFDLRSAPMEVGSP